MKPLSEVLQDWEAIIGLEVHTELTTLHNKMFCTCKLSHHDEPNTHVCPVCLGMPGALPVPNEQAIESIVRAGLACDCQIMKRSMFYRKHYFYPDMAKNFQTTQGPVAFCMHGHLNIEVVGPKAAERSVDIPNAQDGYQCRIGIHRIHMEEDAAKMIHVGGDEGRIASAHESLIDYNRCGTPLIELVTDPDLRTPEEARVFMETLRTIFLTLGISDCSLESGSMRCDGNVSIRRRGTTAFGTKTELKNMNSLKNLHDALEYEICRQAELLEQGESVQQETRHWEASKRRTICMRVKETADDYRLFPDPDLAPFDLSDAFIERMRTSIPELPQARAHRYVEMLGVRRDDTQVLVGDPHVVAFFESLLQAYPEGDPAVFAKLLVNDVAAALNASEETYESMAIAPQHIYELADLYESDAITSAQGRELLAEVAKSGESLVALVDARGLRASNDVDALAAIVDEVIQNNPAQVEQYRSGNAKVLGFLVGQCMKLGKEHANPKLFNKLLSERLQG